MNTKHTNGPWRVMDRTGGGLWIQGEPDVNGFRSVCEIPSGHFACHNGDANARLIAAAPTLAAALQAFVSAMDALPDCDDTSLTIWDQYNEAKAALKEAGIN